MNQFSKIILNKGKDEAVKRFHPWIFSGAIKRSEGNITEGDIVEVLSDKNEFLGMGHYSPGSIAVRIFSFKQVDDLNKLWEEKFSSALLLRANANLSNNNSTNVFRLINAEGDGMPGLIADYYNGTVVLQAHSKGMHAQRENFTAALQKVLGNKLKAVYDKSDAVLNKKNPHSTKEGTDTYLFGSAGDGIVTENGNRFVVDWEQGQKTGFFIDQRDNRQLLSSFSNNKKVLNTFCYSGGFSVYALQAGASEVHSMDSSAKAMELTEKNIQLNNPSATNHKSFTADIFEFMKTADADYDVMVLDPPAFAKNQSARHQAVQAYRRLNYAAFKKIKTEGIIFTFSCSQAVDPVSFKGAIMAAAIDSGRFIKILHHLTQPADHPVSIFHPEGLYLKGFVLMVE